MAGFTSVAFRRRLYLYGCITILGLEGIIYIVLFLLWCTKALDRHLFSLTRLSTVSLVLSVSSQVLSISTLAIVTYLAQALASDRTIRARQTLAILQDRIEAWQGLGSSIISLWRGRRRRISVQLRMLVVFVFFAVSSVLQIIVPATITVQSINSTVPMSLSAVRLFDVTDGDMESLGLLTERSGAGIAVGSLPFAMDEKDSFVGVPQGVAQGVWFTTLDDPAPETVTFTDPYALQPSILCASKPSHEDDQYDLIYTTDPPLYSGFGTKYTAVVTPGSGVLEYHTMDIASFTENGQTYQFGGEKASREAVPNQKFDDIIVYLPLNTTSTDESSANYGNVVFVILSTRRNLLEPNSMGIQDPIVKPMTITVWSWVANSSLNETERQAEAFPENITVTFYLWPIVCSLYTESIVAKIRGDNALLTHTFDTSESSNTTPFMRPLPTSPLERTWGTLFDQIFRSEVSGFATGPSFSGAYTPSMWLEDRIIKLVNGTSSSTTDKITALEADFQSITSIAYSLMFQELRNARNTSVAPDPMVAVAGERLIPMARLQLNILLITVGILCVGALLACVVISAEPMRASRSADPYMLSGDVLDMMCLMRGSTLPVLLAEAVSVGSRYDSRREKAEEINVHYSDLQLDTPDRFGSFPPISGVSDLEYEPADALAMTEMALARVSLIQKSETDFRDSAGQQRLSTLHVPYFLIILSITVLSLLHILFLVLWRLNRFERAHFDLNYLGLASQTTAIGSQIITVAVLGLLSYAVQKVLADKYIRREQTVQDLHDSVGSLPGPGTAIRALWKGWSASRRVLPSVVQLCLFWIAAATLHITMPAILSVNTVNVTTPAVIEVTTLPGNLVNIGVTNISELNIHDGDPTGDGIYSQELINIGSAVPFIWESQNASIRLPLGLNDTIFFSTPTSVSSAEFVLEDPYAKSLCVRCGVIPQNVTVDTLEIYYGSHNAATPQTLNQTDIVAECQYQYTREDGLVLEFSFTRYLADGDGMSFGGEKPTEDAPPNLSLPGIFVRSVSMNEYLNASIAGREAASFAYVSLNSDAVATPTGFTPPVAFTTNFTVLSWVNNTQHPTTVLNGQPIRAFNESVTATFYVWMLGCTLHMNTATARVRGDSTLLAYNATSTTPITPFPFLNNEPQNALEAEWIPLLDALTRSEADTGDNQGATWFEQTLQADLQARPNITTLEDDLASMTALFYALLIQRWRTRDAANDTTLAENWSPNLATVQGSHPVLMAGLQVNPIPLIVGCLCTAVLVIISLVCLRGHDTSDNVVRDGGVIDLVSLLHDSALPGLIAGEVEDGNPAAVRMMFETRSARARRALVAYGQGSLDLPERVRRRMNSHLDPLTLSRLSSAKPTETSETSLLIHGDMFPS